MSVTKFVGENFDHHDGVTRFPVKGDVVAKIGDIAVLNGGYLDVGAIATGLKIVGTFAENVDTTGKADGDPYGFDLSLTGPAVNLPMDRRFHWFKNATAGDAIAQAEVGTMAYINSATAVTKTTTGRSKAGTILGLSDDAAYVCVAIKPLGAD